MHIAPAAKSRFVYSPYYFFLVSARIHTYIHTYEVALAIKSLYVMKWFKIIIPKVSNQANIFEKLAAKVLLFFDICKKIAKFLRNGDFFIGSRCWVLERVQQSGRKGKKSSTFAA